MASMPNDPLSCHLALLRYHPNPGRLNLFDVCAWCQTIAPETSLLDTIWHNMRVCKQ